MSQPRQFANLAEFWPFYLAQHRSRANRVLHALGSFSAIGWVGLAVAWSNPWLCLAAVVNGYGCAWFGHFVFEGNKPATFGEPRKSFICDWIMLWLMVTGQLGKHLAKLDEPAPVAVGCPEARESVGV